MAENVAIDVEGVHKPQHQTQEGEVVMPCSIKLRYINNIAFVTIIMAMYKIINLPLIHTLEVIHMYDLELQAPAIIIVILSLSL